MKRQQLILSILAAALLPPAGWCDTPANTPTVTSVPVATQPPAADATATKLSAPVREVVKMALSGVPDDVIKAYIANSRSTFNLNADAIINLHGVGVSTQVTAAMLSHDRALIDISMAQAGSNALPSPPAPEAAAPVVQPMPDASVAYPDVGAPPANYYDTTYSELAPYGSWDYFGGYGWCWQPFASFSYPYFPGGGVIFGTGRWINFPGRGLCWLPGERFPGSRFESGNFVGGTFRGSAGFRASSGGFVTGRSVSSVGAGTRVFSTPGVIRSSAGTARVSSSFHGFGGGSVSVTHIGGNTGGHFAGSVGGHVGGSFGGHAGGGFGGHAGGGFGGHGGGRGR